MTYQRVCPRDLFNESKLLKCIGKISLLIHDYQIPGLYIRDDELDQGFEIDQNPNDGSISITNLRFSDEGGEPVYFSTSMNSKENWPLTMEYKGEEYYPLSESGELQISDRLFLVGEGKSIA